VNQHIEKLGRTPQVVRSSRPSLGSVPGRCTRRRHRKRIPHRPDSNRMGFRLDGSMIEPKNRWKSCRSRDLWHNPDSAGRQADRPDGRPADGGRLSKIAEVASVDLHLLAAAQARRPPAIELVSLAQAQALWLAPRAGDHETIREAVEKNI